MAGEFLIEGPEDFTKELEFDKFMDEILIKETKSKSGKGNDEEEGEDGRKILKEYSERPGNSTRWK